MTLEKEKSGGHDRMKWIKFRLSLGWLVTGCMCGVVIAGCGNSAVPSKQTIPSDVALLAEDADLIRQVEHSREDRNHGRIYAKEAGLNYLRTRIIHPTTRL